MKIKVKQKGSPSVWPYLEIVVQGENFTTTFDIETEHDAQALADDVTDLLNELESYINTFDSKD